MAHVRLILKEEVPNLGEAGDVVTVKPGFARNFLLPQGKAIVATESQVKELEHHRRVIAEKIARERKNLEAQRGYLEALVLEIAAKAGEEGKLFGSVTASQIAELLGERGIEVDRRKIELEAPIKDLGEHRVPIRLQHGVVANVKLKVTATE
jgi:large subunit ribosomal protein L9